MKKIGYDEILEFLMYMGTLAYIIYGVISKEYMYSLNGLLTLVVIAAPRVLMKRFKFNATTFLKFLVQFFIFVSMFLGRLNGFYGKVPYWDTFLHTISGFIIFLVAYVVFIIQNKGEVKNVNPVLVVTYCVLFAVAMTAVWEMWEFAGDQLLGLNSQGGSLFDTMKDIITGSIGPIVLYPFLLSNLRGRKNKLFDDLTLLVLKK
ncbi:hypothetical protein [Clostridium sp.]|uniref:hypothetical protein n=1 Tax=Clostridium sp. TaxID=1506 RepID=UPI003991D1F8